MFKIFYEHPAFKKRPLIKEEIVTQKAFFK